MIYDNSVSSKDSAYNMLRILPRLKSGLNIVHLNAQSLNNKLDEFKYLFTSSDIDIICVSETWFHPCISDNIYNVPGYKLFRCDRQTNAGGAAIYVKHNITCNLKITSTNLDLIEFIFVEIISNKEKILVGCVYRRNRLINFDSLMETIDEITLNYNDVIIAGDFNSNLFVEDTLLNAMQLFGLQSVNLSVPTHFGPTSESLLDVFFVNNLSKMILYDQLTCSVFSRHDIIYMTYKMSISRTDTLISYRDYRNVNYVQLNHDVEAIDWNLIYTYDDVNDQIEFIQSNIINLYNLHVPLKTKLKRNIQEPWFDARIKELISRRDNAFKNYKRFKTSYLYNIFRLARRDVVKHIRQAKASYFNQKFSSALDNKAKWREIRKIGIGQGNSGNICSDVNVDVLNDKFVNIDIPQSTSNIYDNLCYVPIENSFSFRAVNECEVVESFLSIKSNAIGADNLDPTFVKSLLPKLLPYLTHFFNTIITKSIFPKVWKTAKILPIPKSSDDFRPIAILPFLSKVMEKILYRQMLNYLSSHKLLTSKQSGFTKGKSCTTSLIDVSEDIRSKLDENMVTFLVLLDHSKAFDAVNRRILLKKLEKLFHFSNSACRLILSYLADRSQFVQLNDCVSNLVNVSRGVPQGSILGPLLFCIYINDLPDVLKNCNFHIFADDVQIYYSTPSNNINICIDNINNDLRNIHNWASNNGLCINPRKSKCIFISRRCNLNSSHVLKINDTAIEFVRSSKNLGLTFNSDLTWSNHINGVVGRICSMLRNLWTVQVSTPLNIRLLLAKTYLIPVLLYGCELFSHCDSTDMRKLNVAYNNIARYVFNKRRSDSISSFSYQLFNMSFENLLKLRSLLLLHKIINLKQPTYLHDKLRFANSRRGKKLILPRFKYLISERQFFIGTVRLWNQLPTHIQTIFNADRFRKELVKYFS